MIRSMTGYGRFEKEQEMQKVNIEISSVNHRYCDITIRLPRMLNYLEEEIRKSIKKKIARGKVEINLYYAYNGKDNVEVIVNESLCQAYIEKLRSLGNKYDLRDDIGLSHLLTLQDVLTVQKAELEQERVTQVIMEGIDEALEELLHMRQREGRALKDDILIKLTQIKHILKQIEAISGQVVLKYEEKLRNRLDKLLKEIPLDESKLATELAVFADKSCIDEELTRLQSHIHQLEQILEEGDVVGRKIDFLMQEMNREANTIASKTNEYSIANYAIELKTEMEKIREQIQNIE